MLDFRYHVTSLAAVFLALIVGILVGVGISGRGFVDKSERHKLESRIERLQNRVDELSTENDQLRDQQVAGRAFMTDAYPVLMADRLRGTRVGVIVVGADAGSTGSNVTTALKDAGVTAVRYRALKLPVPRKAVRRALRGRPGFALLPDAGHELAQEWVTGGKTPVADSLATVLVEEQRGSNLKPVDAVVVIEAEQPQDEASRRFVDGLYSGLGTSGVPVVAVEESRTTPSTVPGFRTVNGFSTVDDVDTHSGRLALALLLDGAPGGAYGLKPTADAPLPKITQAAPAGA